MSPRTLALAALLALAPLPAAAQRGSYFPAPDPGWEHRPARAVGMDSARLAAAIGFAVANESKLPRDLERAHYQTFGREPFGQAVGPFRERGAPTGIVVRHGYIVAEWGDPERVDMTFSVSKSFLSTVVGLAVDRELIRSVSDTVRGYVAPTLAYGGEAAARRAERLGGGATPSELLTPFESAHNRTITWDHLLRQTSDWEGTLWGKPEWADRPTGEPNEWATRPRKPAGSAYEYNDVRVNVLALAALNVWRRPLPEVLAEYVMEPIGPVERAPAPLRALGADGAHPHPRAARRVPPAGAAGGERRAVAGPVNSLFPVSCRRKSWGGQLPRSGLRQQETRNALLTCARPASAPARRVGNLPGIPSGSRPGLVRRVGSTSASLVVRCAASSRRRRALPLSR